MLHTSWKLWHSVMSAALHLSSSLQSALQSFKVIRFKKNKEGNHPKILRRYKKWGLTAAWLELPLNETLHGTSGAIKPPRRGMQTFPEWQKSYNFGSIPQEYETQKYFVPLTNVGTELSVTQQITLFFLCKSASNYANHRTNNPYSQR